MVRLVRATWLGTVLEQVALTSRVMTNGENAVLGSTAYSCYAWG
jgi:hypothetical protein